MNELAVYEATELSDEAQTPVDMSANHYTAEAVASIADLDDEDRRDALSRGGLTLLGIAPENLSFPTRRSQDSGSFSL